MANKPHSFVTFFPLGAAVRRKIFKIIGNQPVPEFAQKFPIFKSSLAPKTYKPVIWYLWDGEREWRVDRLSEEEKKYPTRGICNDTALIQLIEEGYVPEHDT